MPDRFRTVAFPFRRGDGDVAGYARCIRKGCVVADANLHTAWLGILLGSLAGATQGLFFHREDWLGGYASWPRRMLRLGHVSFFGIGFINLAFALSVRALGIDGGIAWPSRLFIVAAVTMPLLCYLSSFRTVFRHLFFIPVLSVVAGTVLFLEVLLR
jgi:hypothetical protein